ncbi:MAG: putative Midasin, partial [Streblomastix strix]
MSEEIDQQTFNQLQELGIISQIQTLISWNIDHKILYEAIWFLINAANVSEKFARDFAFSDNLQLLFQIVLQPPNVQLDDDQQQINAILSSSLPRNQQIDRQKTNEIEDIIVEALWALSNIVYYSQDLSEYIAQNNGLELIEKFLVEYIKRQEEEEDEDMKQENKNQGQISFKAQISPFFQHEFDQKYEIGQNSNIFAVNNKDSESQMQKESSSQSQQHSHSQLYVTNEIMGQVLSLARNIFMHFDFTALSTERTQNLIILFFNTVKGGKNELQSFELCCNACEVLEYFCQNKMEEMIQFILSSPKVIEQLYFYMGFVQNNKKLYHEHTPKRQLSINSMRLLGFLIQCEGGEVSNLIINYGIMQRAEEIMKGNNDQREEEEEQQFIDPVLESLLYLCQQFAFDYITVEEMMRNTNFPSLLCTILSQPTLFTSKERMIVVDIVYECITCFDNQFFLKNGQAFRHDGILWGVGIKVNMNDQAAVNSHLKLIDVLLEVGDKENKMEELQEFGGIDLVERVAEDEEGDSSEENIKDKRKLYTLRHANLGCVHNAIPREHKKVQQNEEENENPEMTIFRVKLATKTGVACSMDYIPYESKGQLSATYFFALENVIPKVPQSAIRQAFDLIETTVARFSLDTITSRGVTLCAFATKVMEMNLPKDDPCYQSAVAGLDYLKHGMERMKAKDKQKEVNKFNRQTQEDGFTKGFLCDRKDIFAKQFQSNTLLKDSAVWMTAIREKKQKPIFAEKLLSGGHITQQMPRFVTTPNAIARLDIVAYALRSGVPLLIQGPTSASKSLTAQVATIGLFNEFPLIYALSEQTEVGDLLGRKMLRRRGTSMLSYVPGVLSKAYETGRVLLLDEFDLCPPKVLSSILSALDGTTIEVDGRQISRHQNFRIIATLNGETSGFTSQQRNVLSSEILARFRPVSFPEMNRTECNDIFSKLIPKSIPNHKKISQQITDVHVAVANYYLKEDNRKDYRGTATMTLRNFNASLDLMEFEKLCPYDACYIAYLSQIPQVDRDKFKIQMDALGKIGNFRQCKDKILIEAKKENIHTHTQFIDAAINAVNAARAGLHVLLEGPSGSGLTTLARFVAKFCTNKTTQNIPNEIPIVLLGPESTVENIIGSFKPQEVSGEETDLTKLIKWENGPLLIASQAGIPVILDRIDEAKAQVTERLNPVLEKNMRRGITTFFVPEKGEQTEEQVQQGFVVIATLTINPHRQTSAISPALRNRFVTIAVEHPELTEYLRTSVAQAIITKTTNKIPNIKNDEVPFNIKPTVPIKEPLELAKAISSALANTKTLRDVAILTHASCCTYGIVNYSSIAEHIALSNLQSAALGSDAAGTFVLRTLNEVNSGQRFFYEGDKFTPMWQSIAALTISSASGWPLFLQGEPGCGKTEAVRHFSANRTFHAQNPVFSVSCSAETLVEQFIGSLVFEKNGFRFVEGPLVQAARQGFVFLADEFNLLPPAVMISLVPFLSARPGDTFIHPEVHDKITVACGFLFVATGNEDNEHGRVKLPEFVDSLLHRIPVINPSDLQLESLIDRIMKSNYPKTIEYGLKPSSLRLFIDKMKETLHIKWSLRDVRRFLRRVNDFVGTKAEINDLEYEIKSISSSDVALSFILSGHAMDTERKNEMIEQTIEIFGGSLEDAIHFAKARTKYHETYREKYLIRGHIAMKIEEVAQFPQPLMDTLFWIRWTGTPDDQVPRESVLLVGPTSYKATALKYLLPENANIFNMARETQVSELIGSTILSTPTRFEEDMSILSTSINEALNRIGFKSQNNNQEQLAQELINILRQEKEDAQRGNEIKDIVKRHDIIRGALFLQLCLDRIRTKLQTEQKKNKSSSSSQQIKLQSSSSSSSSQQQSSQTSNKVEILGLQMSMSFIPSIVTFSAILGIPLLLKSIHLPPASVLERLNSLLEDPRSLVLTEDTQQIFNNENILRDLGQRGSRSAPICSGFCLSATTSESGQISLSGPLLSRFTCIYTTPYRVNISKQLSLKQNQLQNNQDNDEEEQNEEDDDLRMIAEDITNKNHQLIDAINDIHRGLNGARVKITITEFIRWCRTAKCLHQFHDLSPTAAAGVSALRTIVDALSDADRRRVTKDILSPHLQPRLNFIVFTDTKDEPVQRCPLELVEGQSQQNEKLMKSSTSGVSVSVLPNATIKILDSVIWTRSAVDMADAVLTSIASKAITIFEGSPGRGKTAVAHTVLQALGLRCTRINLSPTTTVEDLFGRDMPMASPEGGFQTHIQEQNLPSQAILFDEINLAPPHLLEVIEIFMLEMGTMNRYFLPNGKEIIHKPIVIVATMNSAALSNARSALSTKLQGASHLLRLVPFSEIELDVLAKSILGEPDNPQNTSFELEKIMKVHKAAASLLERETGTASERDSITLRELLRFRLFHQACPMFKPDQLIELVYATQFSRQKAEQLLKEVGVEQTKGDVMPLIRNGKLVLTDTVQLTLPVGAIDGPIILPFTAEQRRVACLIGAGIMAHRPIAIFGESGVGKTHMIRTLAQAAGKQLGVVQFNTDTDSSAIIGALEIDGNATEMNQLYNKAQEIAKRAIDAKHFRSVQIVAASLSDQPEIDDIAKALEQFSDIPNNMIDDQETINKINADAKQLYDKIISFQQRSARNFVFKEGILLRMMRQGGWVLLDGVESAPHEVERLMSLLEEEPTLAIYEGVRPLIFHGRGVVRDNSGENEISQQFKDGE